MKTSSSVPEKIAVVALFLIAIAWRLAVAFSGNVGWLGNFAPLAAIVLCGAIYFPRRVALLLPLAALFVSDLVLNIHYQAALVNAEMLARYVALALAGGIGLWLRARPRVALIMAGSVAGSVIFYLITNAVSWWSLPAYPKTVAGLLQALTTGLPGFPPTWMFFRNTLASDVLFTLLFVACLAATRERTATLPAGAFSQKPLRP